MIKVGKGGAIIKKNLFFCLVMLFAFTISACYREQDPNSGNLNNTIADRIYVLENGGFGGNFTIMLNDDGTYQYSEGSLSSYFGTGVWALDGDILCLSENVELGYPLTNWFRVEGNALVFLSEKSTNFIYVNLPDNARFNMLSD